MDRRKGVIVVSLVLAGAAQVALAAPECRVYVANISSDDVTVIDAATDTVVTTVSVGVAPDGAAASPDGAEVYVANAFATTVSVIDAATNVVVDAIPTVSDLALGIASRGGLTQLL
jgi:YVTN family beta-propeller protein